jgi:hypothetical protein
VLIDRSGVALRGPAQISLAAVLRRARTPAAAAALAFLLAGCIHLSHSSSPPTTSTTVRATTTTTAAPRGVQESGPRTVLSPIGLNVRQAPSKSAKVVASAAQGVTLTVVGHTLADGGWYEVRGQSAKGWISAEASLSAPGTFLPYQSNQLGFTVLYPSTWKVQPLRTQVNFTAPAGGQWVAFRTGPPASLPHGSNGHELVSTQTVVPCGVTTTMFGYAPTSSASSGTGPLLAQVRIPVNPKSTLAIDSAMAERADVAFVLDFVNSVTFADPQCAG